MFIFLSAVNHAAANEWKMTIPDYCWSVIKKSEYVINKDSEEFSKLDQSKLIEADPRRNWVWNWESISNMIHSGINQASECQREVFVASRKDLMSYWKDQLSMSCSKGELRQIRYKQGRASSNCEAAFGKVTAISMMNIYYQSKSLEEYRCKRSDGGLLSRIRPLTKPSIAILEDEELEVYEIIPPKPKANPCFGELTCDDKILMAGMINRLEKADSDEERLELYQMASAAIKDQGKEASMHRINQYLQAKSAEISAKENFDNNQESILRKLNAHPFIQRDFQDLGQKVKEVRKIVDDLRDEIEGRGLVANSFFGAARKFGLSPNLQTDYEQKLSNYIRLQEELDAIKMKIKRDYKDFLNSPEVSDSIGANEKGKMIRNFSTFIGDFTAPLNKGLEEHYDEAIGAQGAMTKVAESLMALEITLIGAWVPVGKKAVMGCGVNLLSSEVKDVVSSVVDAYSESDSSSFWCSYTRKGRDAVDKGIASKEKAFDCGIGAAMGLVLPPILSGKGRLATGGKVIAGGAFAGGLATQGIEATLNFIESDEELSKGNTEVANCKFNKAAKEVSGIAVDILSMSAENKIAGMGAQQNLKRKMTVGSESLRERSFLKLKRERLSPMAETIGDNFQLTRRNTRPTQVEFPSADRMGANEFGFKSQAEIKVEGFEARLRDDQELKQIMIAREHGKVDWDTGTYTDNLGRTKEISDEHNGLISDFINARADLPVVKSDAIIFDLKVGKTNIEVVFPSDPNGVIDEKKLQVIEKALRESPVSLFDGVDQVLVNPKDAQVDRIGVILGGLHASKAEGTSKGRLVNIFPAGLQTKDNRLIGTVIHEMGHTKSTSIFGSTDPGELWAKAIADDNKGSITRYGGKNNDEDFAEAIRMYVETRGGIADFQYREKYKNRFEIIDQIFGLNIKKNKPRTEKKMEAIIQAGLDKMNLHLSVQGSKGANNISSVFVGDNIFVFEDEE
jgi:hypothetical protein